MSDYGLALKYLKVCFEQATLVSDNEYIYDAENNRISADEIRDFIETTEEKE